MGTFHFFYRYRKIKILCGIDRDSLSDRDIIVRSPHQIGRKDYWDKERSREWLVLNKLCFKLRYYSKYGGVSPQRREPCDACVEEVLSRIGKEKRDLVLHLMSEYGT